MYVVVVGTNLRFFLILPIGRPTFLLGLGVAAGDNA
jgi:hypothetical protein